jgi:hypothetical protein
MTGRTTPIPPLPTSSYAFSQVRRPSLSKPIYPFMAYYRITNFEYTLTFTSCPSHPIINKTAGAAVALMPSYSRPSPPNPGATSSTPPHRPPTRSRITILHLSLKCLPSSQHIKLPPNYSTSAFLLPAPAGAPGPPRRCRLISEHPHDEHLARVCGCCEER